MRALIDTGNGHAVAVREFGDMAKYLKRTPKSLRVVEFTGTQRERKRLQTIVTAFNTAG